MLSADLQAAFAGPAAVVHPAGEVRFVGLPQAPLRYAPSFLQLRTRGDPHSYKGGNEEDDALRGRFDLRFPEAREKDKRKNKKERIGQVRFARVPPHARHSPLHRPIRCGRRRRSPRSRWGATESARSARTRRRRRFATRSG